MISLIFLGQNCDGGVSVALAGKLKNVESDLRQTWVSLGAPDTFEEWCLIREPHRAAHPGGNHTAGNALDINYLSNPYIATRSRTTKGVDYGGESPSIAGIQQARVLATVVYDRAMAFLGFESNVANVSRLGKDESIAEIYDRFDAASVALRLYFLLAFQDLQLASDGTFKLIERKPVANAPSAPLDVLLKMIPLTERLNEEDARNNIASAVTSQEFADNHPNWSHDEDFWYQQILRDFEVVRIPMVIGNPSLQPPITRNPVNGLMDLRREIVISLTEVGNLRWGACHFGNSESGDVQHFDTSAIIRGLTDDASEIRIDLQTDDGVQQALASLQFDPGPVDGDVGGKSRQAIKGFRQLRGLPVSEEIDDELKSELQLALNEAAIPF